MSKIICDVCGTSYPDTATQCPICGCVSSADVEAVVTTQETAETVTAGTYTYVKGGRFSKSNVKKRNQGKPVATAAASAPAQTKTAVTQKKSSVKPDQKTNLGLIIIIVVLLLAIVSVLSYIAIRFVVPGIFGDNGDTGVSEYVPVDDGEDDTEPTESVDPDVPCTGIVLEEVETTFSAAGETYMLTVTPEPLETTDEVLFASEDETVATVDESGLITAVAEGSTVITVTCGTQTELFSVVCQFATDNDFVLDAESYTLTKKGDTWTCYTGTIPVEDITWTSDDETIATVDKGVVTAVGTGVTTIRGVYNETEATCEISCEDSGSSGTGDATNGDQTSTDTEGTDNYAFNTHDKNEMMLKVGESHALRLCGEDGKALTGVKYTSSNDAVCTVSEKGTVKCVAYGSTVYISAEYNGKIYKCTVYIR